ncbi:F-BAR and double SH3 domains protein 2-like isoform X2 [Paramacrobiotus metropolitanus]|uniref:F-BAR and double SH3 domains protein 2-like isoform X2 n=1 Tax=Paramacrobiotus metropolitanus TaxID=2943436 RepID=UPI0024462DAD|nr:F-BAR and double SH3 domains protein 2-like isoform X2 [Paramacrobiotus metropolitanus]
MKDTTKPAPKMAVRKIPSPPILKHAIQLEKLQQKAALEASVVENIRSFLKHKATIERDCAVALQKLITQHTSRKDFLTYCDTLHGKGALKQNSATALSDPEEVQNDPPTASELTLAEFWTDCMSGLQKLQTSKISQYDEIIKLTSDELKTPKTTRTRQVKQAMDTALEVHLECNRVVDMITHSRKSYTEAESVIQEAKEKVKKLEQKAKKKGKTVTPPAKVTEILENQTPRATAARNEYILSIIGANSLLSRYYSHDLPYIMDMMNGNVYDGMRHLLALVLHCELHIIPEAHEVYTKLNAENQSLSNRKDIESLISAHSMFKEPVQYTFEACSGDTVSSILLDGDAATAMEKCARKWAIRLLESQLAQKKLVEQIDVLEKQNVDITTEEGKNAFETKQYSLKENLRNETNLQHTAQAILDTLKQAGVDVDTWMASAKIAVEEKITAASSGPEIITTLPLPPRHHSNSTIHSDNNAENATNQISISDTSTTQALDTSTSGGPSVRCTAMYDYSADRQDELSITANEELTVLDGTTDAEWLLVENSSGQQGYVPKTYVNYKKDDDGVDALVANNSQIRPDFSAYSMPSWDDEAGSNGALWDHVDNGIRITHSSYESPTNENEYTEDGTTPSDSHSVHSVQRGESGLTNRTSSVSSQQRVGSAEHHELPQLSVTETSFGDTYTEPTAAYCRAVYDYSADDPEDLSFQEGDVIKIISRSHGDVDDGYWTGELNGRVGLFLSALTEELIDTDNSSDRGISLSSTSSPLPGYTQQGLAEHSFSMISVPDRPW